MTVVNLNYRSEHIGLDFISIDEMEVGRLYKIYEDNKDRSFNRDCYTIGEDGRYYRSYDGGWILRPSLQKACRLNNYSFKEVELPENITSLNINDFDRMPF